MAKGREKQLARTLIDSLDGATEAAMKKTTHDFVSYLAEAHLMGKWRAIEQAIDGAWKEKYGASKVTIVTAYPITQTMRQEIAKMAPGADLVERVDERIIGGAILRIDDKKIDGSVAGTIRRLKQSLDQI